MPNKIKYSLLVTQTTKTASSTRVGKCVIQIGSDWPQMGQIWDFLRSVSVHFGAPRQNVLKVIFKSLIFVPFGANLTHFGSKSGRPVDLSNSAVWLNLPDSQYCHIDCYLDKFGSKSGQFREFWNVCNSVGHYRLTKSFIKVVRILWALSIFGETGPRSAESAKATTARHRSITIWGIIETGQKEGGGKRRRRGKCWFPRNWIILSRPTFTVVVSTTVAASVMFSSFLSVYLYLSIYLSKKIHALN